MKARVLSMGAGLGMALAVFAAGALLVCPRNALAVPNDNGALQCLASGTLRIDGLFPANLRGVTLQNKGPNSIYLGTTSAKTTTALGTEVPGNGGTAFFRINNNAGLWCIAATADQVSPADTRWFGVNNVTRP